MRYVNAGKVTALVSAAIALGGSQVHAQLCCQAGAQLLVEGLAIKGVMLKNISKNPRGFGSAFGMLTLNPRDNKTVLVGWRRYSWPIGTNLPEGKAGARWSNGIRRRWQDLEQNGSSHPAFADGAGPQGN